MNRMNVIFSSIFIIVVFSMDGCARDKSVGKKIILNHLEALMPDQLKVLENGIEEFERQHPGIEIKVTNMPYVEYFAKLQTMTAGGTPPDVAEIRCLEFPAFADKGILLDLTPYIEKEDKNFIDDFYPLAMDMSTYKGKVYGLTYDMCTFAVFYNKDLFDDAGESYPDETWNWEKFLEACKKLTKDINNDGRIDQFAFAGIGPSWERWCVFAWQNG